MASAPGSPWGGGEGLTTDPWSGLLTTRMLAQRKEWSNATAREFIEIGEPGFRESRSDDREKIPGLVLTMVWKSFLMSPSLLTTEDLTTSRFPGARCFDCL